MTARVGIVVLGASDELGDALVGAVAAAPTLGEVRAVEAVPRDVPVGPAAARLAEVCELVVGLGALPFPGLAARHDALRDALGDVPYWAVETWHGLPSFHDALADVVAAALAADRDDGRAAGSTGEARTTTSAHVLVTAPDEVIRTLPPEHRVVLREIRRHSSGGLWRRRSMSTFSQSCSPA